LQLYLWLLIAQLALCSLARLYPRHAAFRTPLPYCAAHLPRWLPFRRLMKYGVRAARSVPGVSTKLESSLLGEVLSGALPVLLLTLLTVGFTLIAGLRLLQTA